MWEKIDSLIDGLSDRAATALYCFSMVIAAALVAILMSIVPVNAQGNVALETSAAPTEVQFESPPSVPAEVVAEYNLAIQNLDMSPEFQGNLFHVGGLTFRPYDFPMVRSGENLLVRQGRVEFFFECADLSATLEKCDLITVSLPVVKIGPEQAEYPRWFFNYATGSGKRSEG